MSFVRGLLRLLAIAFNLAVGFFLLGIGFIGSLTGEEIVFPLVPVLEGESLKWALMGLGLFAVLATFISLLPAKPLRLLMVLWNVLVVALLICAMTRSTYRFQGPEHFQNGVIVFLISLLALWGAWAQMRAAGRPVPAG